VDNSAGQPSLVQPVFLKADQHGDPEISRSGLPQPRGEDVVSDTVEWSSAETSVRAIAANAG
jgi:hypothetical protein